MERIKKKNNNNNKMDMTWLQRLLGGLALLMVPAVPALAEDFFPDLPPSQSTSGLITQPDKRHAFVVNPEAGLFQADVLKFFTLAPSRQAREGAKEQGWSLLPQIFSSDLINFLHCPEAVTQAEKEIITQKKSNSPIDQTLDTLGLSNYQINLTAEYRF